MDSSGLMSPEAAVLMVAGCIAALLGVWLMLMEGPAGGAKIAIFGNQVQAVPVGFAVFLTGSAAAVAPLVAPDKVREVLSQVMLQPVVAPAGSPEEVQQTGEGLPPLSGGVVFRDTEPKNDSIDGAVPVTPGEVVSGEHSGDDWDWFRLDTALIQHQAVVIHVERGSESCDAYFYDWQKQYLGAAALATDRRPVPVRVGDNPEIFIQLACPAATPAQEYTVGFRVFE